MAQRCVAKKKNGTACKAWAVRGSDPPLCGAHGGGAAGPGAPAGNKNAEKHGAYAGDAPVPGPGTGVPTDIDARIRDLDARLQRLDAYIDRLEGGLEIADLVKLYGLQAQMTSRLGRLTDRRAAGDDGDRLAQIMDDALDRVAETWGIEL